MPFPTRRLFAGRPPTHVSEIPPTPDQIPSSRTQEQADKYFRRVANENVLPSRFNRWLSIGGWVVGGVACSYMVLFANFGDKEHVFSPVRRHFRAYTSSLFNLSESEQSIMGLPFEDPVRKAPKKAILPERSNGDLLDKMGKGTAGPMNGEATIRGRFV